MPYTTAPAPVQESLGQLFGEVRRLTLGLSKAQRQELLPSGREALQLLRDQGPQTVPQLARNRRTSRQNLQVLINGLAKRGWVELTSNPAHKRSALVSLTARGEALLRIVSEEERALFDQLAPRLATTEVAATASFLRRVGQLLAETNPTAKPASKRPSLKPRRKIRPVLKDPVREQATPAVADVALSVPDEGDFPVNLL